MNFAIKQIEKFPNGLAIKWNDDRDSFIDFIILDTGSQVYEIGLTKQGEVILLDFNKTLILPNMEVEDIIRGNNTEIVLINKKKEIVVGELLTDNKSINIITTQPHPLKAKQNTQINK